MLHLRPLILATLLLASPTTAQVPNEGDLPSDVAVELARLNITLEEVRDLLVQQIETQTLDLLLKRSQLVSSQVTQLDTLLRRAEASRDGLEDEKLRLETNLETFEDRVRGSDPEIPREELEAMMRQFHVELERITNRLREAEAEVIDLDSQLSRRREDLESWQDLLDRRLGGV